MELNQEIKHQIAALLAKPSKVTPAHAEMLASLAEAYPYYQPIHILLAKAKADTENFNQLLTNAALYNNGAIVHQVVYQAQTLAVADNINIINYPEISFQSQSIEPLATLDPLFNEQAAESSEVEHHTAVAESIPYQIDEQEVFDEIAEVNTPVIDTNHELPQTALSETSDREIEMQSNAVTADVTNDEQEVFEEINELQVPTMQEEETEAQQMVDDELEVYDEIAEINHQFFAQTPIEAIEKNEPMVAKDEIAVEQPSFIETIEQQFEEEFAIEEPTQPEEQVNEVENTNVDLGQASSAINENTLTASVDKHKNENDFAFESIISSDFFAFEKNFIEENTPETSEKNVVIEPEEYDQKAEDESVVISKYDDDKLPYTFLWWLNKTRKEHAQIFQPYATAKRLPVTGELQQQYVEHIFHIQTPFTETANHKNIDTDPVDTKENELIENFIKNDPIIKALKPDQIDNENKAKKSAEDHYDLVSETLASIYIEQMLYHKAIDTYQKLSLKFPEKSRYFADLIQSLEKKI